MPAVPWNIEERKEKKEKVLKKKKYWQAFKIINIRINIKYWKNQKLN